MKINENALATRVAVRECGGVNLPIAQVKEVIHILLDELSEFRASEVMALVEKHARQQHTNYR